MGTNYYLLNKTTNDKLHLCKLSHGWKPLFQAHEGKFTNMKELEDFYFENKDYIVVDEYDDVVDWLRFYVNMSTQNFNDSNKSHVGTGCNAIEIRGWEFTDWEFS